MSASGLARLQRRLAAHVLHGTAVAPRTVLGTRSFRASARLAVYREGYGLRLTEALAGNYPMLQRLLGEERFATLSGAYVAAIPSRSYTLRDLGHRLPAFLNACTPWKRRPGLAELARFEWAMAAAFDAPDIQPLAVADLVALQPREWPKMRLRLHPGVQRLTQRWNAAAVWAALNRDEAAPPLARVRGRAHWLVWRQELRVMFAPLEPQEWAILGTLRHGLRFAQLCGRLDAGTAPADAAQHAASLLRGWVERGLIIGG